MGSDDKLTINLALTIAAPRERVWAALTDQQELCAWLADADVNIEAGRFELFGARMPDAPFQSTTSFISATAPRQLQFAWELRGNDTLVDVELSEQGDGCEVRVCHSGLTRRPEGKSGTTDFWVVALENLRLHCMGKEVVRYDFNEHGPQVNVEVEAEADPPAVFSVLLDPQALDEFWSQGAQIEPHVGGAYSYGWKNGGPTKILELEPDRRLTLDWSYAGEPDTIVTWELEGSGGRTRITLAHTGFDPQADREDYRHGWLGFLVPLKARLELGDKWSRVQTDGYAVEDPG